MIIAAACKVRTSYSLTAASLVVCCAGTPPGPATAIFASAFSTTTPMARHRRHLDTTEALYQPYRKHPELFTDTFPAEWLHKDARQLIKAFRAAPDNADVLKIAPDLLQVEIPNVYSFHCLSPTFLTRFNDELDHFYLISEQHDIPVHRPNSMNNYGVIVNEIGMRGLITSLQHEYIWPLARRLFPQQGSQFDDHHSFIVKYHADEDPGLDLHTDDSDVTFNVCLGDVFTGATLTFCGMLGSSAHRHFAHTYQHHVGRAVLHLGDHRHGADDIVTGRRANLIVWNHNFAYRSSPAYQQRLEERVYQAEAAPPDLVCLSYTHDKDYLYYKDLPERARNVHAHPWCPPIGKGYPGFVKVRDKMLGDLKKDFE